MKNLLRSVALFSFILFITACGDSSNPAWPVVDLTPPVTTVAPAVSGTTDVGTIMSVTINKNGTGYYLVQAASAAAPTAAALVQTGTSFAMTANTSSTVAVAGLSPSTAYNIYFVAKDSANNLQAAAQSVALTTNADITPPVTTGGPSVSGITQTGARLSVTINKNGTGYYLVLLASASAPDINALLAGTAIPMTANIATTPAITGLAPSTSYKVYFIARDSANNLQTTIQNVPLTTTAQAAGYVSQGGMTWMPVSNLIMDYLSAVSVCAGTINGQTGWRLPTQPELIALYASHAMEGQGWWLDVTWSSTPYNTGDHLNVYLQNGNTSYDSTAYVTCVR